MNYSHCQINARRVKVFSGFRFKKWRYLKWLGRMVEKLWLSLAQEVETDRYSYECTRINSDDLVKLLKQCSANLDYMYGGVCKHVVVGWKQMEELSQLTETHPFSVGIGLKLVKNGQYRFMGLTLHYIPWFDGVLLLPELEEKGPPSDPNRYKVSDEPTIGIPSERYVRGGTQNEV